MLIVTIAVISVLLIISYLIFDQDLLAPPTAVALVMLFGALCCFYNEKAWGLEFSPKSTGLIATGIIVTMIGGFVGVCLSNFPKVGRFAFSHEITEAQIIDVSPLKTWVVVFFQLISLYMLFLHVRRVSGYSNWMLAVAKYRMLTAGVQADINNLSTRMPILTKNMVQFSKMFAIVYAYIIGNNLVAAKKKVTLNWIPVILYTIMSFMQGDRSNVIRLWVVVLITAYTIHRRSVGWRSSRETRKVIRVMALSIVVVGAAFAGFREIVGRESDMDPLAYVTFYAGSPTAILDQLWTAPIVKPDIWGKKTLFYFYQSTTAIFGWPGRYNYYSPFITSPNGSYIGNAPTAFKPTYVEFGFFGFALFFLLCGTFFTLLYCKCRKPGGSNPIDFRLLMYGFISYVFLMYFYASFFDFLSHVYIKYMIELLLIRWVLVSLQFKHRIHVRLRLGNGSERTQ